MGNKIAILYISLNTQEYFSVRLAVKVWGTLEIFRRALTPHKMAVITEKYINRLEV